MLTTNFVVRPASFTSNRLLAIFFGAVLLCMLAWFGGFVAASYLACSTFWRTWQLSLAELSEKAAAGDEQRTHSLGRQTTVEDVTAAITAARFQFFSALLAALSALAYIIGMGVFIIVDSSSDFKSRLRSRTGTFLLTLLFIDSICNDICAHLLACLVEESSLEAACRIIAEQTARAAEELVQHDLATSVLQAGPTSAARVRRRMDK